MNSATINVPHLLSTDDTIIFVIMIVSRSRTFDTSYILIWFKALSGLTVNLTRSPILQVGQVDNLQLLTGISSVLGIPIDCSS